MPAVRCGLFQQGAVMDLESSGPRSTGGGRCRCHVFLLDGPEECASCGTSAAHTGSTPLSRSTSPEQAAANDRTFAGMNPPYLELEDELDDAGL